MADDGYAAQTNANEGALMRGMNGGVAGLACIRLFGLPGWVKVEQGKLRVHRAVHMTMMHLPQPGDSGAIEEEGSSELERGIGALNTEDLPTEEDSSGFELE